MNDAALKDGGTHRQEKREKENLWADNSFFLQQGNTLRSKKLLCLRQAKQAARVKRSLYICQSCGLSLPHHDLIVASFGRVCKHMQGGPG